MPATGSNDSRTGRLRHTKQTGGSGLRLSRLTNTGPGRSTSGTRTTSCTAPSFSLGSRCGLGASPRLSDRASRLQQTPRRIGSVRCHRARNPEHEPTEVDCKLTRLTAGRARTSRLLLGLRRGVVTTATLRDATGWDQLVNDLGLTGRVRHGLRHTALTWMADAGVELLQRVAGHQDPAVTARYLHPDHQAVLGVGAAYSRWWGPIWA
jgi:hypothetical protein